jgi:hypothetical protein
MVRTVRGLNPVRDEIFLFSKTSRLPVGPTQPPVQWVVIIVVAVIIIVIIKPTWS